jgi:hypothetical protein
MKDAKKRLQKDMKGYDLSIRDVEDMVSQQSLSLLFRKVDS